MSGDHASRDFNKITIFLISFILGSDTHTHIQQMSRVGDDEVNSQMRNTNDIRFIMNPIKLQFDVRC